MANTKIYEIKAGANQNASVLFSPDRRRFYWNHTQFQSMDVGEHVFFVNRTGEYVFLAKITKKGIGTTISNGNTTFIDEQENYSVSGEWQEFIRFNILEYKKVPEDWKWKSLGSSESTYISGVSGDNVRTIENNVVRIEQLLNIMTDNISKNILQVCKQQLTGGIVMPVSSIEEIHKYITSKGFQFEPWQIAAYVTALRTKPFVILAGVTGTGKSKLPKLVSDATGDDSKLISVRPDWTDSSDVLGYRSLNGEFNPGQLLEFIKKATKSPDKHHVCIIDEMNLARVEHYFAEILSRIEDRRKTSNGGFESSRLLGQELSGDDAHWSSYGLPSNLAIVGTVNMDESAHGFSRKVLDRAFTIELSDIDLTEWKSTISEEMTPTPWPIEKWHPRAIQLSQISELSESESKEVDKIIKILIEINSFLVHAQLQVGYRTRDEIALFVLHAEEYKESFVTSSGDKVDPLDLALQMKILPRIVGGSNPIRDAVLNLLGWASVGTPFWTEVDASPTVKKWNEDNRPGSISGAKYPRTAARLCLMWNRLFNEGFTSFWL